MSLIEALNLTAQSGAVELKPSRWQRVSLVLTWCLLLTAAAKPMWLSEPETRELTGRDLMVIVDLSGSMSEMDFNDATGQSLSRLAAAKQVLSTFSQQREGDRLGLILFGDAPYLQAPFTADHGAWLSLLQQAEVAMAGESTRLGDAIGLAIKTYMSGSKMSLTQRVIVMLTDGNDTDSLVPPVDAAKVAAAHNIRIHMVAMGSPNTAGEQALNMDVIKQVADLTGGQAFLAMSPDDLQQVYEQISILEPTLFESFTYQPKSSLHFLPVLIALLNYLLFMCGHVWISRQARVKNIMRGHNT
ncbi:VWA domain-containing protein [Vibrio sp. 10N.222.51.C12]|uniref:VWA domain-containing protein n=1 Tax=Vibrio sp. 10N.222.51.C12 TaxID=3229622 RepID=UPI00354F5574